MIIFCFIFQNDVVYSSSRKTKKKFYTCIVIFFISLQTVDKNRIHHSALYDPIDILGQDESGVQPGFVTVLQYLFTRVGSRSRLTRISRTITSLTLRDVAPPRINCVRASASASAVVISIAAAATALRLSINRVELRPVNGSMCMCMHTCMHVCVHARPLRYRLYYFAPKSGDYFN